MKTWKEIRQQIIDTRAAEIEPYDGPTYTATSEVQEELLKNKVENELRTKLVFKQQ